jgi:hypothetical protein
MAFPVSTRTTGELITASIWNADVKDNVNALNSGAMAVASQAAGDLLVASSATQLERLSGSGKTANLADAVLQGPEIKDYAQTKTAPSISGGTLTLNCTLGNVFEVTVNANITTFSITNWPATGRKGSIEVWFKGNGTGYTQAWGSVRWPNDSAPVLTTTNNDYTVITFHSFDAGANVFGIVAAKGW